MRIVPGRGTVPVASGAEILDQVPQLRALASVTCEDFGRLPGPHWTPAKMFELARLLDARLATSEFTAAVVTHGTDTLEETAYLLDLVLQTDRPVVLTGAMKTADDPRWDGPANLVASVRAAIALSDRHVGVTAMFGCELHAAREVTKSHTEAFTAFSSMDGHPLGILDARGLNLTGPRPSRERIATSGIEPRVDLVTAAVGSDSRLLEHAVATGARGIVLEALGGGNVPPAMLDGVGSAVAAGVVVVIASRCGHGTTFPHYGYEGGGLTLAAAGAIFSGDLSAPKARIKLMVLLGARASADTIRASFARAES
jgi:L-asparaginase